MKRLILLSYTILVSALWLIAGTGRLIPLPNSLTNEVFQDSDGFIWICTEYGLYRFDGISTKAFYHTSDQNSLLNNCVLTMIEDSDGLLWIGTIEGIQCYDPKTETFTTPDLHYPGVKDFTYVNSIIEDSHKNIWFSTSHSGAVCLKADTRDPIYYLSTTSNLCSNMITALFEDHFGNIWIGSKNHGVSVLNPQNHNISNYSHNSADESTLSGDMVFSIVEAPDGSVLVATLDGGIDAFDNNTHKFKRNVIKFEGNAFTLTVDNETNSMLIGSDGNGVQYHDFATGETSPLPLHIKDIDISKSKIHSFVKDNKGNLWAGVYQKGLAFFPYDGIIFNNYSFNPYLKSRNIGSESVSAIIRDTGGRTWVGTDGDGVYIIDSAGDVTRHINGDALRAPAVLSLYEDSRGDIWLGSYLYGLMKYAPRGERFDAVNPAASLGAPSPKEINNITEDAFGRLWLSTNGDGIYIYNPIDGQCEVITHSPSFTGEQLPGNSIHVIRFDANGNAWIGTSDTGVSCYNPQTKTFKNYNTSNSDLSGNNIMDILVENNGDIWFGTKTGLNQLSGDSIRVYTVADGLPNDVIVGIEKDNNGHLWLSTYVGLADFDPVSGNVISYALGDGLTCSEFQRGAHYSDDEALIFGGLGGLCVIEQNAVPASSLPPHNNLIFSDIWVSNRLISPSTDPDIINTAISHAEEINLPYDHNNFMISYTTLQYSNPSKVKFSVMLEGFDKHWIEQPAESYFSTYSNLPPGTYTFHVKATDSSGYEVQRSIKVIVHPPFYLTWWAKIIYFILLVVAIYLGWRAWTRRTETQRRKLLDAKEKDLMEHKLQFFTDISHEVRTPLTLILSPVSKLLKTTSDPALHHTLSNIDRNGKRILRLINQVMELRKLDNNKMQLKATQTNVRQFITEICDSFSEAASVKNIDYAINISDSVPQTLWLDRDKVDKMLFNLLSNAFKYTPTGTKISVDVATDGDNLRITVSDSGPGVPESQREAIFARFYQVENDHTARYGTGIGLHLSGKLAALHHGRIYVEDGPGGIGSSFVIILPLSADRFSPDELSDVNLPTTRQALPDITAPSLNDSRDDLDSIEPGGKGKYTILVVEDDIDIINYLREELGKGYRILLARDGREGLEIALREKPDCIISDVTMPVMDGIEMCKLIKSNTETCDIPVILLTAKTTIENRIEGIRHGADSYIPKPFDIDHLMARVTKLIELRQAIRDKYSGKSDISDDVVPIQSADDRLLERVKECVLKDLANPDLSVEFISREIGVSRSQLHRKLKALTGQNPSDYIKQTRLRHAAHLLVNKGVAISEAAYATGFSSLSYFSTSFKDLYGMSPSRYVEINRNKKQ